MPRLAPGCRVAGYGPVRPLITLDLWSWRRKDHGREVSLSEIERGQEVVDKDRAALALAAEKSYRLRLRSSEMRLGHS